MLCEDKPRLKLIIQIIKVWLMSWQGVLSLPSPGSPRLPPWHFPSTPKQHTPKTHFIAFFPFLEETVWDILYHAVRSQRDEYQKYISNKDPGLEACQCGRMLSYGVYRARETYTAYTKCYPSTNASHSHTHTHTYTHTHTPPASRFKTRI